MTDNENNPAAAQIQEWICRVCQQVREDNAELARTGKDEKFYTFTLNEMNHLLPLLSVAKASAVPEAPQMESLANLTYAQQTPEDWDADYRATWQKLQVAERNKAQWRTYALKLHSILTGTAAVPIVVTAAPQAEEVPAMLKTESSEVKKQIGDQIASDGMTASTATTAGSPAIKTASVSDSATSHVQPSIDTPEFRELLGKVYKRTSFSFLTPNTETQALIAHIDAKLTQAKKAGYFEAIMDSIEKLRDLDLDKSE